MAILVLRQTTWRNISKPCSTLVKFGTVVTFSSTILWEAIKLTPPVLLLDEADIFLEERTIADLERNSLVSGDFHPRLPVMKLLTQIKFFSAFLSTMMVFLS